MLAANLVTQYMEFVAYHGKSYLTAEEFAVRAALYFQTDDLINAHNATESSFTLGHNKFSDYTEAERSSMLGGRAPTQ